MRDEEPRMGRSRIGAGCGKVGDSQKQAAANIIAGLAGGTGESMADSTAALRAPSVRPPGDGSGVKSFIGQRMTGMMWLTRFQLESGTLLERRNGRADLTLNSTLCGNAGSLPMCTASCNSAMTIYTVGCTLPDGSGYSCDGTAYTFSDSTFSISVDFTDTTGTVGAATGNFDIGISIAGDVSGGELDGRLDCSMSFTVDIEAMKAGTVQNFEPSCDNFRCSYDGTELACADIQSKMDSSTLSCS
jgi:hypothetical protein